MFQVGHIRKGVNPSSAHQIFFSGKYLGKGFTIGIVAGLVALTVKIEPRDGPIAQYLVH